MKEYDYLPKLEGAYYTHIIHFGKLVRDGKRYVLALPPSDEFNNNPTWWLNTTHKDWRYVNYFEEPNGQGFGFPSKLIEKLEDSKLTVITKQYEDGEIGRYQLILLESYGIFIFSIDKPQV